MNQLTLDLSDKNQAREAVDTLLAHMEGREWTLSVGVCAGLGWNTRFLRRVVNLSDGQIVSGGKGYKLLSLCTPEEYRVAQHGLESRAKEITKRSIDLRKAWYKLARKGKKA